MVAEWRAGVGCATISGKSSNEFNFASYAIHVPVTQALGLQYDGSSKREKSAMDVSNEDSEGLREENEAHSMENNRLTHGQYAVRIMSTGEVIVTCTDGYTSTTWLNQERRAWWITWDAVSPGTLSTDPSDNTANGILVVSHPEGKVTVSTDRFGTTPVFYHQRFESLTLSNNFDTVASDSCSAIDELGFWELVLFETPLADRTLLTQVKCLAPGMTLTFSCMGKLHTKRYWNYTFDTHDIQTEDDCAKLCGDALAGELLKYASRPVLLPIGGGVDCRLLAAALHKAVPCANVKGVTYGYDPRIFEYTYAKEVFRRFGWSKPLFHPLEPVSYTRNLYGLVRRTGGLIGMQNCHLYDYLQSCGDKDLLVLSGMYSDAVCGWEANLNLNGVDKLTVFDHFIQGWIMGQTLELHDRVMEGIYADLLAIRKDWQQGSSLTSINEYVYVRERNAKFHLLMADNWRMFAPVGLPFAQHKVALAFFSLPMRFRHHKRCTFLSTEYLAPELAKLKNVSSRFREIGLSSNLLDLEHAWVRRVNRWMRQAFGSRFQFVERAETERHAFNFQFYHADLCLQAYSKLLDYGLCDDRTAHKLAEQKTSTLPLFSYYQILSNIHVLNLYAKYGCK